MGRLEAGADALGKGYISREEYAKIALEEGAISQDEYAQLAPPAPATPAGPTLKERAAPAAKAGLKTGAETVSSVGSAISRALKLPFDSAALELQSPTRIPGAADIAEAKAALPGDIASKAAELAARAQLPEAVQTGVRTAGAALAGPAMAADIGAPVPATIAEGGLLAAIYGAGRAIGPLARALQRRLYGVEAEVVSGAPPGARPVKPPPPPEAPVETTIRPPVPALPAPSAARALTAEARLPLEAPPVRPALQAPPARPALAFQAPVQGEGFQLVRQPMRRVFDTRRGELDFPREEGLVYGQNVQQAIARRLGLPEAPVEKPISAKKPVAAPQQTAAEPAGPKLTKKLAKELLGRGSLQRTLEDPAAMDQAVELVKAGKVEQSTLQRFTQDLARQYRINYRVNGPDAPETQRVASALQKLGIKPVAPEIKAPETAGGTLSTPPAPAPGAVVPPPAPATATAPPSVPAPAQAGPSLKALEREAGRPVQGMTLAEFQEQFPNADPAVHREAVRQALMGDGRGLTEESVRDYPDLEEEGRRAYEAELERQQADDLKAQGYSNTPVLEFLRKRGISKSKVASSGYGGELENLMGKGVIRDTGLYSVSEAAEALAAEGILPEYSENMLFDAINHELRTGRPYVPETARPGQEGAINPQGARQAPPPTPALDELERMRSETPPKPSLMERFKASLGRTKENTVEYLAPLDRFVKEAEKLRGRPFTYAQNAMVQAQLFPGARGIVQERLMRFEDVVAPIAKRGLDKDLDHYLTLRQFDKRVRDLIERANAMMTSGDAAERREARDILRTVNKAEVNPRGFGQEKVKKGLAELDRKLGPVKMRLVELAAQDVWRLLREVLTEARDAGLIKPESYNYITSRGDDYTPIEVIEHINDELGGGPTRTLSQRSQDILMRMEGTTKGTRGALPATYQKISRSIIAIERNKVAQKFVAMRSIPGMEKQIRLLGEHESAPEGFEKFYVFERGVRRTYAVPAGVARSVLHMGQKEMDFLSRVLTAFNKPFKAGATGLNINFAIPNFVRDLKDFATLSEYGLRARNAKEAAKLPVQAAQLGMDLLEAFFHVIKKDDVYRNILSSRALFSTIQKNITPEAFLASLRKQEAVQSAGSKLLSAIPRLINILEETPKVASSIRGQRAGDEPDRVALETRRYGGTPDLEAKGFYTPDIGALYPFFGARVQGTRRAIERAAQRPGELSLLYGISGVLAILGYLHNKRFRDYDTIPENDKRKNQIWMTGIRFRTAEGKEIPFYFRISRTQLEEAIFGTMESALDMYFNVAGADALQEAVNAVTSFSPLTLNINVKKPVESALLSLASGLNPVLKNPIELLPAGGLNTYQQIPLESLEIQQREPYARYRPTTTETAKLLGRIGTTRGPEGQLKGGVSPIKIEQGVRNFTGGLGQMGLEASDAILRALGKAPPSRVEGFERFARLPVVSRFIGQAEPQPAVVEKLFEFKKDSTMDKATAKFELAQAMLENSKNPSAQTQARVKEAATIAARIDPDILGQAQRDMTQELLRANSPSRALDIYMQMPVEEQVKFLAELGRSEAGLALKAQLFNASGNRRMGTR